MIHHLKKHSTHLLLTALAAMLWLPAGTAREQIALDSIVAIVNDNVIVRSELDAKLEQLIIKLNKSGDQLPPRNVLEQQVLDHLISRGLQLQTAQRAGINVDSQVVARTIGNIAKRNQLTISELREALEMDGVSFAQFREDLRNELITSRLQKQEVYDRITVTNRELRDYLESNAGGLSQRTAFHVLHILIATPEAAAPEAIQQARDKAERLAQELRDGADFRQTAIAESDGRQALDGGDLGWLQTDELPSLVADRVQFMSRGEIIDPIRTTGGFHIIKLEDYRGGERHVITQTHARHILINTNEIVSDATARNHLAQLRERITHGDEFSALARSHSDDKATAIKGGDLGWVSPGDLVPKFEEEMEILAPGQLSPPFRTQFGWHIVQVIARREHDSTDEIRRSEAMETLRKRKSVEATDLWLRRLRDEAYVEILLDR